MPRKKSRLNPDRQKLCLLGAHFSIAKGLDKAIYEAGKYECTAIQIFTKNASAWKERILQPEEIDRFVAARAETRMTAIASHTSYLINIASPEKKNRAMSRAALKQELIRSASLAIDYVVLHPGAHMGSGEPAGIRQVADGINRVFAEAPQAQTRLLLETTAGQGSSLGHRFEQLAEMIERIDDKDRIGVCLDTSHVFAAGYDIRDLQAFQKTFNTFDTVIGLKNLYLLHLNDSKKDLGTRVDRHEHIGLGFIGLDAFKWIMNDDRLLNTPKIIETPKKNNDQDWDKNNLDRLRTLIQA
jgi:deoxyribonuclease-4